MIDTTQSTDKPTQISIDIQKIYVKEQSCKAPQAILPEGKPENNLELRLNSQQVKQDIFEVTLTLHVTQKIDKRTTLTIEVQQAGLFKLGKTEEKALTYLLNVYCPSLIYPYAAKVVSNLSMEAGLPPVLLMPMNFESMYREQAEKASKAQPVERGKGTMQEAVASH